jgi:carbon monoxide dehydrogenase subunit G
MAISTSIEVNRPPTEVFTYVTDPRRFSEWQEGVVEGHATSDAPQSVGDQCVTVRRIGFAKRTVSSRLTRNDPPHTWSLQGIDGPIRAAVDVTVEPLDNDQRSRVTIEIDFFRHGVGRLIVPLMVRPQARKEMPANLRRLKQQLETRAERQGGP